MGPIRFTAVLALALLAAGCASKSPIAPTPTDPGLSRDRGEVAIAECGFSAHVLAIDGNADYRGKPLEGRFALEPGEHTFTIALDPDAPGAEGLSPEPRRIRFEMAAGHTYDISAYAQAVSGRRWALVITNRTTGEDLINPYRSATSAVGLP